MHNKTVVFDAQQEIAELKRRVEYLEKLDPDFGKAVAYAQGLNEVPYDAYTAKIHNQHIALNIGNLQGLKTNPELLDALKRAVTENKENKID